MVIYGEFCIFFDFELRFFVILLPLLLLLEH